MASKPPQKTNKQTNKQTNNNNNKICVVSLEILDIFMWQCIYTNDILRASKHVIIKTHKETDRQTVWETGTQEGGDRKTTTDTIQSNLSQNRKFQANFRGQTRQESSTQVQVVKDQSAGATGMAFDTWRTTDSPSPDNPNATGINSNIYMALHNELKRIVPLTVLCNQRKQWWRDWIINFGFLMKLDPTIYSLHDLKRFLPTFTVLHMPKSPVYAYNPTSFHHYFKNWERPVQNLDVCVFGSMSSTKKRS